MKLIDLNNGINVMAIVFPDNQPHVRITGISEQEEVQVVVSLTDSNKLLQLLETANALDNLSAKKKELIIPYLMGARYDRLMQPGDSFDLKVIADLINSCGFEKVILFDIHSDAACLLIKNSVNIPNKQMVQQYRHPQGILICPDAGAAKRVGPYFEWNKNLDEISYCNKSRNVSDGQITLEVLNADQCEDKNCVIIDDICDGGATFLAIAEQIKPRHLTLIVTHGIFSQGFSDLEKKFDEIIVSNSCCKNYDSQIVRTVNQPWLSGN